MLFATLLSVYYLSIFIRFILRLVGNLPLSVIYKDLVVEILVPHLSKLYSILYNPYILQKKKTKMEKQKTPEST